MILGRSRLLVEVVSLGVYTSLILQSQDLLLVLESLHHWRHIAGWVIFRFHLCPQFSSLLFLDCESCQFAKHHHLSYSSRVNKRASAPFELVHSDVWGSCPVVSPTEFQYFVTFVDDYS